MKASATALYQPYAVLLDVPCSAADLAAARDKYTTILAHRGPMACEAHPWGLALWPGFQGRSSTIRKSAQIKKRYALLCSLTTTAGRH